MSPDGRNINLNCGSTHLEGLSAAVVKSQARLGVAFDGDGDRALVRRSCRAASSTATPSC